VIVYGVEIGMLQKPQIRLLDQILGAFPVRFLACKGQQFSTVTAEQQVEEAMFTGAIHWSEPLTGRLQAAGWRWVEVLRPPWATVVEYDGKAITVPDSR
jgi:hypothetical protein